MDRLIKTDADGFVRDTQSNAVINTNVEALSQYKRERAERLRADQLEQEVMSLKQDVTDIKHMLQQICERL